MDPFTPQQTHELVARIGAKKASEDIGKLIVNSFMTGPLLGFGGAVFLLVHSSPWYEENAPGLIKILGSCFFPIGYIMVMISGADAFTTNVMFMTTSYLTGRISLKYLLRNWVVSFLGNTAGVLFFAFIICGFGSVFDKQPYRNTTITIAMEKVEPEFWQIFLKGIAGNWLLCFSVWAAVQGRDLGAKIMAVWWPTVIFEALSFDHVIADLFFVPMGMFHGADIGVGYYIWKSLIPTLVGNIVGGSLFIGVVYWYIYLSGGEEGEITFEGGVKYAVDSNSGPPTHERSPRLE